MKKFLSYLAVSLLFINLFVSTGCEDDPVTPDVKDPPLLILGSASDVEDGGTIEFEQSQVVAVKVVLTATVGTDDLNIVKITGVPDVTALTVTGNSSGIGSNTVLLSGADRSGFTWNIEYLPANTIGEHTVSFEVADAGGLLDDVSFTVKVVADPIVTTPLDATLTGVLFNQSGPTGRGTLDLDEGKDAGVTSAGQTTPDQTEIRDMGIDCSQPNATNWRRQIGAFNGTVLRKVDATQVENFTFNNVDNVEAIKNAFDTGISYASAATTPCSGSPVTVQHVSAALTVGDLLVVKKGDRYYLIRVDEVNVTTNDNEDNYKMSIKHGSL